MSDRDLKIVSLTWEDVILEAMMALTGGYNNVPVPVQEMYQWIESTSYLTDKGRQSRPPVSHRPSRIADTYPAYVSSVKDSLRNMSDKGFLLGDNQGNYRLPEAQLLSFEELWKQIDKADAEVKRPGSNIYQTTRIQRDQQLRDLLVKYYASRCQICGDDPTYAIPTLVPNRFYVQVHHVDGLAETFRLISCEESERFQNKRNRKSDRCMSSSSRHIALSSPCL